MSEPMFEDVYRSVRDAEDHLFDLSGTIDHVQTSLEEVSLTRLLTRSITPLGWILEIMTGYGTLICLGRWRGCCFPSRRPDEIQDSNRKERVR